jgi:hypothetical protein
MVIFAALSLRMRMLDTNLSIHDDVVLQENVPRLRIADAAIGQRDNLSASAVYAANAGVGISRSPPTVMYYFCNVRAVGRRL